MTNLRLIRFFVCCAAVSTLAACSTIKEVAGSKDINYRSTPIRPALEVPPDLTQTPMSQSMEVPSGNGTASATYSTYEHGAQTQAASTTGSDVLPAFNPGAIKLVRDGNQRWLVAKGTPQQLWPRIREFWIKNGLTIAKDDPQTGIMETDWAENRPNVGNTGIHGFLHKWLGSLYSTGTRDKFHVRLEQGSEPGTTDIFLTDRGMVEKVSNITGTEPVQTMWEPRPPDPELEADMLRRLMVYLGVGEKAASTMVASGGTPLPAKASLTTASQGYKMLTLNDDFERAWRRVGLALDQVGFTVEDRNRSEGIYYVRYIDTDAGEKEKKPGWFSRLFHRKHANNGGKFQYQVKVTSAGNGSTVTVHDKNGAVDHTATADHILTLLAGQLK